MFVITARKGSAPMMRYTGRKFSDKGRALTFRTRSAARTEAQSLIRRFPVLAQYNIEVRDVSLTSPDVRRAASLLKNFSGHDATESLTVADKPFKTGLVIGPLLAVGYETVRDGETLPYMHEFRKSSRPLLAASSDGKQLRIVGGRFQFTERGIVDR